MHEIMSRAGLCRFALLPNEAHVVFFIVSVQSPESPVVTWCQKWDLEATRAGAPRSFAQRRKSVKIDHSTVTSVSQSVATKERSGASQDRWQRGPNRLLAYQQRTRYRPRSDSTSSNPKNGLDGFGVLSASDKRRDFATRAKKVR